VALTKARSGRDSALHRLSVMSRRARSVGSRLVSLNHDVNDSLTEYYRFACGPLAPVSTAHSLNLRVIAYTGLPKWRRKGRYEVSGNELHFYW
jgi:hypothetical protein